MAKTDKIRAHLVLPDEEKREQEHEESDQKGVCPECSGDLVDYATSGERICDACGLVVEEDEVYRGPVSRTDHLSLEFRDRFSLAYEQFSGYVGELDGETVLSTEIVENREDHREDIGEIYDLTTEEFPDADVLMTEQYSPRNRQDEDFLAYSYDVIIRVCNTDSNAPAITRRIELTNPKVRGSNYLCRDGRYIVPTGDTDLTALDLNEGAEYWRRNVGYDKLSGNYDFEEGIVQTTRNVNTVFLVSWEDGTIEWEIEDVTADEKANLSSYGTWEPAVSDQTIYAGGFKGTIYQIDVTTGAVEEIITLSGEIRAITFDAGSLYVTTATEQEESEEDTDDWSGGRKSHDFSLLSLSNGEIRWQAEFEESGRGAPQPHVTSDTVVTEANDELKAYDRQQGNERWFLNKENFESELPQEEESELRSSFSHSFELKILDSIGDTIYCVGRFGNGFLVAINSKTGEIEWVNQEYNTIPYNLGVIHEHDGKLVFNHQDNDFVTSFVALDSESGTEEWRFATPGRTGGDRSIGSEFVFVTSQECIVFDD